MEAKVIIVSHGTGYYVHGAFTLAVLFSPRIQGSKGAKAATAETMGSGDGRGAGPGVTAAVAAGVIALAAGLWCTAMCRQGEADVVRELDAAAEAAMLRWRAAGRRAAAAKGIIAGGADMPQVERRRYNPADDGALQGFLAKVAATSAVPVVLTGIPLAEGAAAVWADGNMSNALLQAAAPTLPGV